MGVVYLAHDLHLNRRVALKMILAGDHAGEEQRARFLTEAETVAQLDHPNIVQIHEVGLHEGRPYLALEYVDGGSLARNLNGTPQPVRPAAALVERLARAVQHAHERGIIHRDLKPANVLLSWEGEAAAEPGEKGSAGASPSLARCVPRIADFGLAKHLESNQPLTRTDQILGTPQYMAPEQAVGKSRLVGPAADVYALGAILYELLSGRPPFTGPTAVEIVIQVLGQEPVPVKRRAPRVPADLATICMKCLEKDPGRRYASARALADDLRRFQEGEPILARRVGEWERLWKWAQRRPVIAGLLAAIVLVTFAGLLGVTWQWWEAVRARNLAENQKQETIRARDLAENQKQETIRARDQAEQSLYTSNIARALLEWRANKVEQATALLDRCPEERRGWEWRYLDRLCHGELFHLPREGDVGHNGWVTAVAFSPDGRYLISAGGDPFWSHHGRSNGSGRVILWEAATGRQVRVLGGQEDLMQGLALSSDGRWVVGGAADHVVKVWLADSGKEKQILRAAGHHLESLALSPDGRLVATLSTKENTLRVWDVVTGKERFRHPFGLGSWGRSSLTFSPNGQWLVGVVSPGRFHVWSTQTGVQTWKLDFVGNDSVPEYCLAIGPAGRLLALGGSNVTLVELPAGMSAPAPPNQDARQPAGDGGNARHPAGGDPAGQGRLLRSWGGHVHGVTALAFSPDGRYLASGGRDTTVRVWRVQDGQEAVVFRGHTDEVTSVAFSPDGARLASGSKDGTIKLWDLTQHPEYACVGLADPRALWYTETLAFTEQSDQLVVARRGGWVARVHTATGTNLAAQMVDLTHVWISPGEPARLDDSGTRLAGISQDDPRLAKVWDTATGQVQAVLRGHEGPLVHVTISADGRRVATAGILGPGKSVAEVKVWDRASGRPLWQRTWPGQNVTRLAFSPDGELLALALGPPRVAAQEVQAADALVAIHDAATGVEKRRWQHDDVFAGLAFRGDGGALAAVGFKHGTVLIGNPATGEVVISHQGPPQAMDVTFNPAGTRLAVASRLLIKLLDARTGEEMLTLRGLAQASANSAGFNPRVRFSPDGLRLAAICHGSISPLSVWSVAEETPALRLETANQRAVIWHVVEARSAVAENNRPAAQWHLARLPARFLHGRTALAVSDVYLQLGQWDQAAAAHAQAAALLPADDDRVLWYKACFLLHRGDEAGYREACAQLFERPGRITNHEVSQEIAELCVQVPGAVADPERIVQAAARAQPVNPTNPNLLYLLGLAHYRAGQYPQALRRLKEALALSPDGFASQLTWLGLALVYQRLGQPAEARQWLDRAVAWHREQRSGPRKDDLLLGPDGGVWWWGTLSFEVLRREAETTLAR